MVKVAKDEKKRKLAFLKFAQEGMKVQDNERDQDSPLTGVSEHDKNMRTSLVAKIIDKEGAEFGQDVFQKSKMMQQTRKLNAAQTTSMMSEVPSLQDLQEQVLPPQGPSHWRRFLHRDPLSCSWSPTSHLDLALSPDRKGLSAHN